MEYEYLAPNTEKIRFHPCDKHHLTAGYTNGTTIQYMYGALEWLR